MCVLAGSVLVHRTASLTFDQLLLHERTLDAKCGFLCCIPIAMESLYLSLFLPSQHPSGCLVGLDSRACVPRTSHVIVRMDRECFACFLGCGTFFMGKGSLALVPKSLSVYRFTGMTLLPRL